VHCNIVAECLDALARERFVNALGFLQAYYVWLALSEPSEEVVRSFGAGRGAALWHRAVGKRMVRPVFNISDLLTIDVPKMGA
jgi:hypothetical protein